MRMTRKTLVSLVFLGFGFTLAFCQSIQWIETVKVPPEVKFQESPTSFCITEDKLFLFPDLQNGSIKVFQKEGNVLQFVRAFGSGNELFNQPRYCFYSRSKGKLGVIDYGLRKVFIFKRNGLVEFDTVKSFDCKRVGYDIKFAGDGIQTIVSGYTTDMDGNPFDLYSININSEEGKINEYLLPSHLKYGLKTHEEYVEAYFKKQTLPSIGIKGFFDVQEDNLYYFWEGAPRIIKLNLLSKEITQVFGQETPYYKRPDGSRLSESYLKGDFETTWKLQESFSYVRNIFATSQNVFVVYETGKTNEGEVSTFRLQVYTPEGVFLNDVLIPGNPGRQMTFDKESNDLYTLMKSTGAGKEELAILKYKIRM